METVKEAWRILVDEWGAVVIIIEAGGSVVTALLSFFSEKDGWRKAVWPALGKAAGAGIGLLFCGFMVCMLRAPYSLREKESERYGVNQTRQDSENRRLRKLLADQTRFTKSDFSFEIEARPHGNAYVLMVDLKNNTKTKTLTDYWIGVSVDTQCSAMSANNFTTPNWSQNRENYDASFDPGGKFPINPEERGEFTPNLLVTCQSYPEKMVVYPRLSIAGTPMLHYKRSVALPKNKP